MAGFSGLSLRLKPKEPLEVVKGFKSISIMTNRRQYIERAVGFKGLSIVMMSKGSVIKTVKKRR